MILPTKEELDAIDMEPVKAMFQKVPETRFLTMKAGEEHYRLLRWISEKHNEIMIAELGSYMGLSTVCLAWNKENVVYAYDVDFSLLKWKEQPKNVDLIQVKDQSFFHETIIACDIIFVDTNHFGVMELAVYKFLKEREWKGVLIYDDIYLNDEMKRVWESIDKYKIDATALGHVYGTGIVKL